MVNKRLQVWLPLLLSVVMVVGMVIGFKLRENTSVHSFFDSGKKPPMQEVLDLIRLNYVDEVPSDSLGDEAINGLLHRLDPHSVYIPASEIEFVNDDLKGNFSGIGIEFQMFYDTLNVLTVLPGGPSEKAGMQVGDKVLKVNDSISVVNKHLQPDDIRKLLRGDKGSAISLTVLRNSKVIPINITRGTIAIPSVDAAYMLTPVVGFIHINKFGESTYKEFMKALEDLQKERLQKLILDLRGNPGGYLGAAVNIADEFLDEDKMIVYTEGKHVPKSEYKCKREGLFEKGQLVLLVDESSASASEVLGAALQDWDRATIVGRRTFGKGLVQEQFQLGDGAALRLTIARYFSPLGRNIQKPYTTGYEKYEEEVLDRFHNGEVLRGDTAKQKGPSFKTPKGHIVYGGGGITPDVYVSFDTAAMGKEAMKLYTKGVINNFIYNWFIANRSQFTGLKKPSDMIGFKAGENEWNALKSFAAKDSINLSNTSSKDKNTIIQRIPALLARQMWRSKGYYEVMNKTDEFVVKALEVLK